MRQEDAEEPGPKPKGKLRKLLVRGMSPDLIEVGLHAGRLIREQCLVVAHKFQTFFPHSSFLNLGTDKEGQPGALHGVMLSLQATVPVLASKKRYLQ